MRRWLSILLVVVGAVGISACSGDGTADPFNRIDPDPLECAEFMPPPPGCDDPCPNGDSECQLGTYCFDGVCGAQCTAEHACPANHECNSSGRCILILGGTGGTGGTGTCNPPPVTTSRIIPNIMMIVDRSGSMDRDFNNNEPDDFGFTAPSRWDAVVDALVGTNGLVRELDSIARFGLTLYWKEQGSPSSDGSMCADTDEVAFSQSLGATTNAIATTFSNNPPDGYTPTAEAIEAVTASLDATPPPEGPTAYLLATDGLPNGCDQDGENEDRNNSVNAVSAAFDLGVETFVLGVNFNDNHLQDLANAGQGMGSGATLWTADSVEELQTALEQIVEQNIPCTVKFDKAIANRQRACDEGTITLGGMVLDCPTEWDLQDGSNDTIVLLGAACDSWKAGGVTLTAAFPCGVVVE